VKCGWAFYLDFDEFITSAGQGAQPNVSKMLTSWEQQGVDNVYLRWLNVAYKVGSTSIDRMLSDSVRQEISSATLSTHALRSTGKTGVLTRHARDHTTCHVFNEPWKQLRSDGSSNGMVGGKAGSMCPPPLSLFHEWKLFDGISSHQPGGGKPASGPGSEQWRWLTLAQQLMCPCLADTHTHAIHQFRHVAWDFRLSTRLACPTSNDTYRLPTSVYGDGMDLYLDPVFYSNRGAFYEKSKGVCRRDPDVLHIRHYRNLANMYSVFDKPGSLVPR
jgi:hypothetical protein